VGNPPGVIGKKYRPTLVGGISGLKVLKPPSQPVSPSPVPSTHRTCRDSPVPSPPQLATVTASQPLCRFCRAGPGRPSVTDPSSVADVVNLYIRYSKETLLSLKTVASESFWKLQFNYYKIQARERPENRKDKAPLLFTFVVISFAISLLILLKR